jgi:glycosyltransferase involved in cell wall biosynthesis
MNVRALPRLAIVLSHPIQYYSPWFRWLREHTDLTCRVFYLWDFGVTRRRDPQFGTTFAWDVDLLSGYDAEFIANTARRPGTDHFGGLRNPTLLPRLEAWQPGAILLFGYRSASQLRVIRWARRRGIPLIFRGDSHLLGRGRPPWPRRWIMAWVYRQFAAVTYVGAANRDYFLALGVPSRRMFFAPHAVDPSRFDPGDPAPAAAARELRVRLGLSPDTFVVLFAGKLVAAKQPQELLAAFLRLQPARTALVIVGDGAEEPALATAARAAPPGTVHLLPFANQSEMPARYRLADLFVLPSRGCYETWGLAVNEAMQLGVPCLVSDRVGCQQDLVTPGETGWVFRSTEPADLAAKLAEALATLRDPSARERYRQAVAARIAQYSYARATDGLLQALASLP